jgi:hypothetical protein
VKAAAALGMSINIAVGLATVLVHPTTAATDCSSLRSHGITFL